MIERLPNYDSWKLQGPPETAPCPKCGEPVDEHIHADEIHCSSFECDWMASKYYPIDYEQ